MAEAAFTYIAESMVKAVGVAGIEAMAMRKAIMMVWQPLAEVFSQELLDAVILPNGEVRPERAELIMARHKAKMTHDFIEEVAPQIEEFAGYAYDRGREYILSNAAAGVPELDKKVEKADEAVVEALVSLTGSTKKNVQRTIKRWFKTTQGEYFDRFIVPETARLMSYADTVEGNITSLRKIGMDYKKFVEADAYWSSVSEFNAETSKIWAQVQTLHEVGVDRYTIVAIIDKKTCPVCIHMNGTTWGTEKAVAKIYDMIISEADDAYMRNPFPPRSTPKDYPDPQEAPFELPPYHPRCRCNIRSEHKITMMPQDVIARPFDPKKPPTDRALAGVFNKYVTRRKAADITEEGVRALTAKEFKVAKNAWRDMPYELKKWGARNERAWTIEALEGDAKCRVIGDRIQINAKYLDPKKRGPEVLQHELRHALINQEVLNVKGGGEVVWNDLQAQKFRMPTHVNAAYQLNGGRGFVAANAAADEFLALIGDYYSPGMSMDDLVKRVRDSKIGIRAGKAGQITAKGATLWSAKEAKAAVNYWWYMMDVDDLTLLTKKQLRAKLSHMPTDAATWHLANANELRLRDVLRSAGLREVYQEGDRRPFDVWIGANPAEYYTGASTKTPNHMIEVKTMIRGKNDKITMPKDALARKRAEEKLFGKSAKSHTVVFDERTGKIYYRDGLGSFRLANMTEVTEAELQVLFGGNITILEAPTMVLEAAETTTEISRISAESKKVRFVRAGSLKKRGTISNGNINEVQIVTIGKRGRKKYIFKPVKGESLFRKNDFPAIRRQMWDTFGVRVDRFEDLTQEMWDWIKKEWDFEPEHFLIRKSITNTEISMAAREAFALDTAHRLGFNNEFGIVPQFMVAHDPRGKITGVLIEFMADSQEGSIWAGRAMHPEESFQMSVFDYLIGNTDRHENNWMRRAVRQTAAGEVADGRPVYIDHGFSMPGQALDTAGLAEFKARETLTSFVVEGMEYSMNPDYVVGMADRIQKFIDRELVDLAKSYGFSQSEIDAMVVRGQSLAERLRGGNFSDLLVKHKYDYGCWGLYDSYIEAFEPGAARAAASDAARNLDMGSYSLHTLTDSY